MYIFKGSNTQRHNYIHCNQFEITHTCTQAFILLNLKPIRNNHQNEESFFFIL